MSRSADYTIQGFLYQFNQTLSEILKASDDAVITIEGIVEDIEVATFAGIKAIQCKYHETQESYTLSTLYKPLLQMMVHFASNPASKIEYHLFAHFPNAPQVQITASEIGAALKSKNKDLKGIINQAVSCDIAEFLKVFTVTVTEKYDDLVGANVRGLGTRGFTSTDIETLYYPNAIQIIADLSIKHDPKLRKITKAEFFARLSKIRSTAISQWTLALKTHQKILSARRKQLKEHLSKNIRHRHVVMFPASLEQFDEHVVLFIKSFISRYHFKAAHTHTPLFAIDVPEVSFELIAERLLNKSVVPNIGRAVRTFSEAYFFRDPLVQKDRKEFDLRLIRLDEYRKLTTQTTEDDLFVLGAGDISGLGLEDVNVELIGSEKFSEIKYVMGLSDAY